MTIVLNKADAIANARKAYEEGRLGFQNQEALASGMCLYRYPNGCCCGIGASFTDEQAQKFDGLDQTHIAYLVGKGFVSSDDPEFLVELQRAHDNLLRSVNNDSRQRKLEGFLTLIGVTTP